MIPEQANKVLIAKWKAAGLDDIDGWTLMSARPSDDSFCVFFQWVRTDLYKGQHQVLHATARQSDIVASGMKKIASKLMADARLTISRPRNERPKHLPALQSMSVNPAGHR